MDAEALRLAIARRNALDAIDPKAVSLDRAIAACVPTLLAKIAQLEDEIRHADAAEERRKRAAESESRRFAAPWLFSWLL